MRTINKKSAGIAGNMMKKIFKEKPWSKQKEIFDSVFDPHCRTTLVRSCTGAGKTRIAASIAWCWLLGHPGRIVLTTAPTNRQVRELLWKEIRTIQNKAKSHGIDLGVKIPLKEPEARVVGEDGWLMIGFSSNGSGADGGVNFQGWHSEGGTLVIADEAIGVSDSTFDALEATLTGVDDRMLALANPTKSSGRFFELNKATESRSLRKIHISAFDVPNVVRGRVVIPGLTTREFVEDRKVRWGEDSALYKARILGEFPDVDDDVISPLWWVERSTELWKSVAAVPRWNEFVNQEIEFGLDVARLGIDKTILARARFVSIPKPSQIHFPGIPPTFIFVDELIALPRGDTMKTARDASAILRASHFNSIRIDADGIGAGVFDKMKQDHDRAVEWRGGRQASDPARFFNLRSEAIFHIRELLNPHASMPILIPPNDNLAYQLTTLKFGEKPDGRIFTESKDEWRARTKRGSTDELDAITMAIGRALTDGTGVHDWEKAYG